MKEINLPITQTVSLTLHRSEIEKSIKQSEPGHYRLEFGTIDDSVFSEMATGRKNGGHVLYAATSIEQKLEDILLEYFMGPFVKHDDKRVLFEREILKSSTLSYRAKKELVSKIIAESELLPGNKKNVLQGHLKDIMEWRNAFAHGKIQHDSKIGCFVSYYSGHAKKLPLTDKYLDEVEVCFKECDALLSQAQQQIRTLESNNS